MTAPAFSSRKFAARAITFGIVVFAIPFPYYWWSLSTGSLPPEAEWWAQGTNHGPWRWEFPGMALVLLPLYALILGAPGVVLYGLFRAIRGAGPVPLAISLGMASLFIFLAWVQGSTLFWTID